MTPAIIAMVVMVVLLLVALGTLWKLYTDPEAKLVWFVVCIFSLIVANAIRGGLFNHRTLP